MSNHPEDQEIVSLFMEGGSSAQRAFAQLVEKYGRVLYSQIRRITRNHEITNDVLQDVLVKVYQNLGEFRRESNLYTWMYRIARNETLNFLEKEKRRTGVDVDPPVIEIIAGHAGLDQLNEATLSDALQKAMDALPEKQALVFQLRYFEDLKFSEIAARLGTSEGALKANYHHARKKIEAFLIRQLNL